MADNDNTPGISAQFIRQMPLSAFIAAAESIVESDSVIRIFAACEWDCLNDDGKQWIAGIVREALARAADQWLTASLPGQRA